MKAAQAQVSPDVQLGQCSGSFLQMRAGFSGPLNQRFEFRTQARTVLAPNAFGQQPVPEGCELVRTTVLPSAGGRTVPSSHARTARQG
jgi:hypothetical protein